LKEPDIQVCNAKQKNHLASVKVVHIQCASKHEDEIAEDKVAREGEEDLVSPDKVVVFFQNLSKSIEHPSQTNCQEDNHQYFECHK